MAKDRPDRKLSVVERLMSKTMGDGRTLGREGDPAAEKYPELWEFMTRWAVSAKEMKTPAQITFRAGPDGFIASFSDRDMGLGVDVAVPNLDDAWALIEAALCSPTTVWKNWGKKEPKFRKRNI